MLITKDTGFYYSEAMLCVTNTVYSVPGIRTIIFFATC